jgi:hypothetical protein
MSTQHLAATAALPPLWDAVRIVCIGRLISSTEYFLFRRQFTKGGLLDYEPLRKLRYKARTPIAKGVESLIEATLLRYVAPLLVLDAALSIVLEIWPALWPVVLGSVISQYLIMRRDMFSTEGADQMTLMVLLVCGLGEISKGTGALAAAAFLAATAALAYAVSAAYKARARPWVTGEALLTILATTTYGHPALREPLRQHRRIGAIASFAVLLWESAFSISVISPPAVLLALLVFGIGFHLMCGLVMGLNHFLWAFVATYPAVIYLNSLVGERQAIPWEVVLAVLWMGLLFLCWNSRPYSELATRSTPGQR